jgi:hypothetical protein
MMKAGVMDNKKKKKIDKEETEQPNICSQVVDG